MKVVGYNSGSANFDVVPNVSVTSSMTCFRIQHLC